MAIKCIIAALRLLYHKCSGLHSLRKDFYEKAQNPWEFVARFSGNFGAAIDKTG